MLAHQKAGAKIIILLFSDDFSSFEMKKRVKKNYSGNLNTFLVRYSNVEKEVGCQMVWY